MLVLQCVALHGAGRERLVTRERRAACTWNAACFRRSQLVESKLSVKGGNSYSFVIADWLKTEHTGASARQALGRNTSLGKVKTRE